MRPCRRISWALPSIEISQLTCLIPSLPGPNYRYRTCWVDASSVLGKLKLTDVLIQFHANYPFSCFVMGKIICSFCSWFLGLFGMALARQLLQELHQTGCSIRSSDSTILGELELFLEVLHQNHKTWLQLLRLRLRLLAGGAFPNTLCYFSLFLRREWEWK